MYEHVRVCRDCGEEYRPEVARCADCGGELEDRRPGDAPATEAAESVVPDAELDGLRPLFQTSQPRDLVPMVERLRQLEVECRLAEQPSEAEGAPPRYSILVAEGDMQRALAALTDLIAPHEDAASVHAVESRFDREQGYLQCPACGAVPPRGASECPECGLGLHGEEAAEAPGE